MIVLVMGVCGSGKTSVGEALAEKLACDFLEGDDLHPPANRQKMAAGQALNDNDRWPWLDAIALKIRESHLHGQDLVVACSALKQIYRDRLRQGATGVRIVHLTGSRECLAVRLDARVGHFMPPALLDSQLATLETPAAEENAMTFDIDAPLPELIGQIEDGLGEPNASLTR